MEDDIYKEFYLRFNSLLEKHRNVEPKENRDLLTDVFRKEEFKSLYTMAPVMVFIFNRKKLTYDYYSENIKDVLGYPSDFLSGATTQKKLSLFDPHHAKIYGEQVFPVIFEYFEKYISIGRILDMRLSYDYKIRKADGSYIWVLTKVITLNADAEGRPESTLGFCMDINELKKTDKITLSVSDRESKEHPFETVYFSTFPQDQAFQLTQREVQILRLMSKGHSSIEIGQMLKISEHTVNTHRKNMLEKNACKNASELLKTAHAMGVL